MYSKAASFPPASFCTNERFHLLPFARMNEWTGSPQL